MSALALIVLGLFVIPMMAFKGVGYRGLYFGGVLILGAAGFFFMSMMGHVDLSTSAEQQVGQQAFNTIGPIAGPTLIVWAFASLIGGVLFRAKPARVVSQGA